MTPSGNIGANGVAIFESVREFLSFRVAAIMSLLKHVCPTVLIFLDGAYFQ